VAFTFSLFYFCFSSRFTQPTSRAGDFHEDRAYGVLCIRFRFRQAARGLYKPRFISSFVAPGLAKNRAGSSAALPRCVLLQQVGVGLNVSHLRRGQLFLRQGDGFFFPRLLPAQGSWLNVSFLFSNDPDSLSRRQTPLPPPVAQSTLALMPPMKVINPRLHVERVGSRGFFFLYVLLGPFSFCDGRLHLKMVTCAAGF